MKTFKYLLFGLSLFLFLPKIEAQNLVTNGGFETGDFTGWSQYWDYGSAPTIVNSNSAPVHGGTYGAELWRVVAQGPAGVFHPSSTYISQNVSTQPSASYLLSFWLYTQSSFNVSKWTVSWNGTQLAYGYTTSTGWTNIQLTVTATGASSPIQFGFYPYTDTGNASIFLDDISVTAQSSSGYDRLTAKVMIGGNVQLSFLGNAGTNYALDRTFSLLAPVWTPQATNIAGNDGTLLFTNVPNATTNNFWRVRSVP